jgi:hypothetical protein
VPAGGRAAARSGIRFRDWNPDVRTAVRAGADLDYSSRTNEVYSSRLGRKSGDGTLDSGMWTPGAPDTAPGETVAVPSPATESSVSKRSLQKKEEEKKKIEDKKD